MASDERRAWRDWSRVEECLAFGIKRWGIAIVAALLVNKYVAPISEWLAIFAVGVVICVRQAWVNREDARLSNELKD